MNSHVVTLEIGGERGVRARSEGNGESEGQLDLDNLRERTIQVLADSVSESRLQKQNEFQVLGSHLYEAIFGKSGVGTFFEMRRTEAKKSNERLLLQLTFHDDPPKLASLPWEYLFCPATATRSGFFLSTDVDLRLARYVPRGQDENKARPETPSGPLRVLLCVTETGCADEQSVHGLLDSIPGVTVKTATGDIDGLPKSVDDFQPHVLHFIGQGRFDPRDLSGDIALLGDAGERTWLPSSQFAQLFRLMQHPPALVVLHLAETNFPRAAGLNWSFSRVAPPLVQEHVDTVVAMHYPIKSTAAEVFAKAFYRKLVKEGRVAEAVQHARFRTAQIEPGWASREFGTPVLYMHRGEREIVRPQANGDDPRTRERQQQGARSASEQPAPRSRGDRRSADTTRQAAPEPEQFDPRPPDEAQPAHANDPTIVAAALRKANELDVAEDVRSKAYARLTLELPSSSLTERTAVLFEWTSDAQDEHIRAIFAATAATALVNELNVRAPSEGGGVSEFARPLEQLILSGGRKVHERVETPERKAELDGLLIAVSRRLADKPPNVQMTLLGEEMGGVDDPDWQAVLVALFEATQSKD